MYQISLSYSRMALLAPAIKLLSPPIYDLKTMKRKSTFELCPSLTTTLSSANLGWKNGIPTLIGKTTRSISHRPHLNKPFRSRNLKKSQPSPSARHHRQQDTISHLLKISHFN